MAGFKISDFKEGELYFFNVSEEDKPQLLEAYQRMADATEEDNTEIEVQQANLPFCKGTCNRFVPFCLSATVPNRATVGTFFQLAADTSCVECVVDTCLLQNATVANPCGGSPITGCDIPVNRVRAVGSITATLGVEFTYDCGTQFFDPVQATETETFCVDNILCFTCNDNPCPNFCGNLGLLITFRNLSQDLCGNDRFTVAGFFILPSCIA